MSNQNESVVGGAVVMSITTVMNITIPVGI
jgi:hypothetical protein